MSEPAPTMLVVELRRRARARFGVAGTQWTCELTRPRLPGEKGPAWPVFTGRATSLEYAIQQAFEGAGVQWDQRQLTVYVAHRFEHSAVA